MKRSIKIFYANTNTGLLETRFATGGIVAGEQFYNVEQIIGVQVLLDKIAKLLLTANESNYYNPELGSAIGDKSSINFADKMLIELALHDSIKKIETQIINEQTVDGADLDPEQKLASLEISNIYQGAETTTWYVEVIVRTLANQSFFLTV